MVLVGVVFVGGQRMTSGIRGFNRGLGSTVSGGLDRITFTCFACYVGLWEHFQLKPGFSDAFFYVVVLVLDSTFQSPHRAREKGK